MSKLTKTESLPKSGHVTEVCKEWLVREDGALAYKLQSQEINDFYKGNRFRNAVVREDFPTALHEQIKEKESADRQVEQYRRQLMKQEQCDKRIAKEIAEKLERDLQEQQQHELEQSELIAQQMQQIYVNTMHENQQGYKESNNTPPRPAKPHGRKHQAYFGDSDYVGISLDGLQRLESKENPSSLAVGIAAVVQAERHMQQHADDIELYVDPCNYASLQDIGLPLEEIKELGKKIKQEQKDELLARRLQEMEAKNNLNQEERDRMLAIEAQDKELAKILQDKERAKAKRAKEKARLRKNQQGKCSSSNGLQCGPLFPLPTDCMSASKTNHHVEAPSVHLTAYEDPADVIKNQRTSANVLDADAYSNPIDVIKHQRSPNGTLTNGSLTRDSMKNVQGNRNLTKPQVVSMRDDDIYTLPVDSCSSHQRPQSLNISSDREIHHNSLSMSESYAFESPCNSLNGQDSVSPRVSQLKSSPIGPNSNSTPPYMPIQGTRRSNSTEDRKKRTKDKCTHQ